MASAVTVGGAVTVKVYLVDPAQPAWVAAQNLPVAGVYTVNIPAATIPAGSRLSILVAETGVVASTSRTVYGGRGLTATFADAGVTLTTGTLR